MHAVDGVHFINVKNGYKNGNRKLLQIGAVMYRWVPQCGFLRCHITGLGKTYVECDGVRYYWNGLGSPKCDRLWHVVVKSK